MKIIYYTKDSYKDNTVRVSYFEKDAQKYNFVLEFNEELQDFVQVKKEEYYDKLLFCQRLEWVNNENELDSYIDEVRLYWETRINM